MSQNIYYYVESTLFCACAAQTVVPERKLMADLPKLQEIDICGGEISDLSPLAGKWCLFLYTHGKRFYGNPQDVDTEIVVSYHASQ